MKKLTNVEIYNRVKDSHGETYELLNLPSNVQGKVEVLHTVCNTVFFPVLKDFMGTKTRQATFCPKCSHPSKRRSQKEMEDRVIELDDNYRLVDKYINTHTKVNFIHLECNRVFSMRPNNFFIKGNRCPICPRSKGEEAISKWLTENNFNFVSQYKPGKDKIGSNFISYDFKISNLNILIEFDGRFHYEPFSIASKHVAEFEKRKSIDIRKDVFAKNNGYILHRIPYTKLDEIELTLETLFNDYRKCSQY